MRSTPFCSLFEPQSRDFLRVSFSSAGWKPNRSGLTVGRSVETALPTVAPWRSRVSICCGKPQQLREWPCLPDPDRSFDWFDISARSSISTTTVRMSPRLPARLRPAKKRSPDSQGEACGSKRQNIRRLQTVRDGRWRIIFSSACVGTWLKNPACASHVCRRSQLLSADRNHKTGQRRRFILEGLQLEIREWKQRPATARERLPPLCCERQISSTRTDSPAAARPKRATFVTICNCPTAIVHSEPLHSPAFNQKRRGRPIRAGSGGPAYNISRVFSPIRYAMVA